MRIPLFVAFSSVLLGNLSAVTAPPNIVYILADDMGYGDVRCLNPESRIPTPNLDRLAREGMVFTDAHSTSSVCTPSRYSLLTGRYSWRTPLQNGVLGGFGKPLIDANRLTVPAFLKENGYTTACIGKWHLGMSLNGDWNQPILDGPTTRGFDEFFGISASLDMPPYAFIRNDRLVAPLDTEKEFFEGRRGPAQKDFEAEDVLPALAREACDFIRRSAQEKKPFFLYLPLTAPHTPIAPTEKWRGKSGLSDYGDFVMQTDAVVGEILEELDGAGVVGSTLVFVASDNGFAPAAGTGRHESQGHFPSAGFRGYKADLWEGGHRIPLIARWPGVVQAGGRSDALVSLGDLFATCADILEHQLPANAAEDSVSMLPALQGRTDAARRSLLVHHSEDGSFAIREGRWKLVLCPGSGGWSDPRNAAARKRNLPESQLYDLEADPGEKENLAATHPEIVARMTGDLKKLIAEGRSTPGPEQANEVPIVVRKGRED